MTKKYTILMTYCIAVTMTSLAFAETPVPVTPTAPPQAATEPLATLGVLDATHPRIPLPPTLIPPPPTLDVKAYVLMDADTGQIIANMAGNTRVPPASLTKMMTLYVAFQALKNGQIHLSDPVTIGEKAWRTGGSRMFLKVGSTATVEQLLQGVIVASGNDACVALAEYIGGTEATFAQLKNQKAEHLGMNNSHFVVSTGFPDPTHYSTAEYMILLSREIIHDFPEYYPYFKEKWIVYNNIRQPNRNRLLWRDTAVDGLKTGHTDEAGFCLVASAHQQDMRLIAAVMGAHSDSERANDTQALLNYGFRFYTVKSLFKPGIPITTQRVWFGESPQIELGVARPLKVLLPVGHEKDLQAAVHFPAPLNAPIMQGHSYGTLSVQLDGKTIASEPLIALLDDPSGGLWDRMKDHVVLWLKKK